MQDTDDIGSKHSGNTRGAASAADALGKPSAGVGVGVGERKSRAGARATSARQSGQ